MRQTLNYGVLNSGITLAKRKKYQYDQEKLKRGFYGAIGIVNVDLWTFRDLDFSRVDLSRPIIGPFATRYFSHLFDPSRFATSVIFAVCCQLTVNYPLTTSLSCIQ